MVLPCIAMNEPPKFGKKIGSQTCIQEFTRMRNLMGTALGKGVPPQVQQVPGGDRDGDGTWAAWPPALR